MEVVEHLAPNGIVVQRACQIGLRHIDGKGLGFRSRYIACAVRPTTGYGDDDLALSETTRESVTVGVTYDLGRDGG